MLHTKKLYKRGRFHSKKARFSAIFCIKLRFSFMLKKDSCPKPGK
ncbi:hypothetical protein BACCAP_00995 [Pseudoflavonifractor capillosus ATCC 29799]|uniref:Uncharacterized protein n=1 Tax=Pseudoflavonifractor capillosus ATCC 29799 TaxID=411467 RepID=A6NS17_9FIRM|nr:hypothetical protein BACCAP_00995 [Pseudoflavonifractor capillosus ATCC 29799]